MSLKVVMAVFPLNNIFFGTPCITKKHVDILYSIDGYMERKENFRTHDEPVVRATDLLLGP